MLLGSASPIFLEPLEARIAPASLSGDGKTISFSDADGDEVTVKLSQRVPDATTAADVFKFSGSAFGDSGNQTLQEIDLTKLGLTPEQAKKFKVEVKTKPAGGGNGTTDVGGINATGLDVNRVKVSGNLGHITAGDADQTSPAIDLLETGSLGVGDTTASTITGGLKVMKVQGNVEGKVQIQTTATTAADKIEVGGKVAGGATDQSGQLLVTGSVKVLKVAGGIEGAGGADSGVVTVTGDASSVEVGGVHGGGGQRSGTLKVTGNVLIGSFGNVEGGTGTDSGTTEISGSLKRGSAGNISGDAMGSGSMIVGSFGTFKLESVTGDGDESGLFSSAGGGKALTVSGNLTGGDGINSGRIESGLPILSVKIGGNILGGGGQFSGGVQVASGDLNGDGRDELIAVRMNNVTGGSGEGSGIFDSTGAKTIVMNDLTGGSGTNSGGVRVATGDLNGDGKTDLVSVKANNIIGGLGEGSGVFDGPGAVNFVANNIFGGSGSDSGQVLLDGDVGKFSLALDIQALGGGANAGIIIIGGEANLVHVAGARGGSVTVSGSLNKFTNKFGAFNGSSGGFDLNVGGNLGSAAFGGSVFDARVCAGGVPASPFPAVGSVQVRGDASGFDVFGGFSSPEVPTNANGGVGSVLISGSASNCNIWAGVDDAAGSDNIPDQFIGTSPASTAAIREVKIKGPLTNVGLFAPEIKKVLFPGSPSLLDGPGNDNFSTAGVFQLTEIGSP